MIRVVQDSDIPELLELCVEHARYEKADVVMAGKAEALKNAFATQRLYGWVVERNKDLVGYATATMDYSTWYAAEFLHIDCLYLKEHVRGEGLGKMLVAEMLKLAKEKNCINVQWQTPDWNSRAVNFYSRLGATSKPKIRFYLEQV